MTKPPSSMRLWAMNCARNSATAGPGQATQPSPSRKRRWRSRGSSASRSESWRTNASCDCSDFTGSRRRKPVRLTQAGTESNGEPPMLPSSSAPRTASCSGSAERHGRPRVDRAAEGHDGVDALRPAEGGDLVGEHAALGVAAEDDVPARRLAHDVDGVADRADVVGERALEAALLALRGAEVDDPGRHAAAVEDAHRRRARRDVVDLGAQHERRHEQHGRAPARPADAPVGEVAAQAEDPMLGDDLVRRRLLARLQAAEARDLQRVLRRRARGGRRDGSGRSGAAASPVVQPIGRGRGGYSPGGAGPGRRSAGRASHSAQSARPSSRPGEAGPQRTRPRHAVGRDLRDQAVDAVAGRAASAGPGDAQRDRARRPGGLGPR